MPRSSTRHTREIQGIDVSLHEAGDFDEYNDFTASGADPNPNPAPVGQGAAAATSAPKVRRRRKKANGNGNGNGEAK